MPLVPRKSRSLGDQSLRGAACSSALKYSKSETCAADGSIRMNSVSQLLMESVIPREVRAVIKDAIRMGTFGQEYEHLVRSKNFSKLSNYQIDVLVTNMMASQRFIKAALRCRKAKISDRGFIRLMNITTRLVLDRLVERKARNKFNQHVHRTISDMSRKQWLALTVLIRSRVVTRTLPVFRRRKLRRRFPRVSDNESSGSILSFYNPHSDSSSIFSDSGLTITHSSSEDRMPPVPEDASVIVLELEGDAQFWTSRNDIIGVDTNDGSTYDHEEIIDDGGDSSELVYDVPKASLTTSVPSDFEPSTVTRADVAGRKRKSCSPVSDGAAKRSRILTLSVAERKRKSCSPVSDGDVKRSRIMTLSSGRDGS
ncbi:uncharacterized protein [Watersipora subatra]|uniref:uncharacterized protein n=1 Tax=Watersipora subatra TaxID=2589382 RepID=UPI00355C25D9